MVDQTGPPKGRKADVGPVNGLCATVLIRSVGFLNAGAKEPLKPLLNSLRRKPLTPSVSKPRIKFWPFLSPLLLRLGISVTSFSWFQRGKGNRRHVPGLVFYSPSATWMSSKSHMPRGFPRGKKQINSVELVQGIGALPPKKAGKKKKRNPLVATELNPVPLNIKGGKWMLIPKMARHGLCPNSVAFCC